ANHALRVYYLASVAAGWADFRLRQVEGLERPEGFATAEGYGHFRAGVALERDGRYGQAHDAYRTALMKDRSSVPALLNLARLEGRSHHYADAAELLRSAIRILDREQDD